MASSEKNEKKTTTVVLVRHGECEGNREGLFRGRTDFPLNASGLAQAQALAEELNSLGITKIYSSPLSRARTTAELIAEKTGAPLEISQGFQNITLGPWDGKSKDFVRREYPREWEIWLSDPEKLELPGAESMKALQDRSFQALEEAVTRHEGETFAVVTHRALLKPLLARCMGIGSPYFWRLHIDTASYSTLRHEKGRGYCCTLLNQTNHLEDYISEWV